MILKNKPKIMKMAGNTQSINDFYACIMSEFTAISQEEYNFIGFLEKGSSPVSRRAAQEYRRLSLIMRRIDKNLIHEYIVNVKNFIDEGLRGDTITLNTLKNIFVNTLERRSNYDGHPTHQSLQER